MFIIGFAAGSPTSRQAVPVACRCGARDRTDLSRRAPGLQHEPNYDILAIKGNRTPESYAQAAEKAGGQVKFAYLSADFSNPTGETVDLAGREETARTGG